MQKRVMSRWQSWAPSEVDERRTGILGVLEKFLADRIARIAVNQVVPKVLN